MHNGLIDTEKKLLRHSFLPRKNVTFVTTSSTAPRDFLSAIFSVLTHFFWERFHEFKNRSPRGLISFWLGISANFIVLVQSDVSYIGSERYNTIGLKSSLHVGLFLSEQISKVIATFWWLAELKISRRFPNNEVSTTKTNHTLYARFFPRFWLIHHAVSLCCVWSE